jgi:dephospho-CoA kinase
MLKLGLTGGIGSGKTTVAKIFETLGIPVYYADDAAKRIMNEDQHLKEEIIRHFGSESYINNMLNRTYISKQVFNDKIKLDLLNSLVHPATIRDSQHWMQNQKAPYTIKEAALIFESGMQKQLDYIIGVSAPKELRIERTISRDGISREEVLNRINSQMDEDMKISRCDFIIYNNEEQALLPQVLDLHRRLRNLSEERNPTTFS